MRGEKYEVVRHVFYVNFLKSIFLKKNEKISRRPARQVRGERPEILRDALNVNAITA